MPRWDRLALDSASEGDAAKQSPDEDSYASWLQISLPANTAESHHSQNENVAMRRGCEGESDRHCCFSVTAALGMEVVRPLALILGAVLVVGGGQSTRHSRDRHKIYQ
jgi:hypothetical protein